MKRYVASIIVIFFIFSIFVKAENITITDSDEINYAHNLKETISKLKEKVVECFDEKGGMVDECKCTECSCKYTTEYLEVKKTYKEALTANPGWEDNIIFYQLEGDHTRQKINFAGLKWQFSMKCE